MKIPTRTYPRTARNQVACFIESLGPTPEEGPYLSYILKKSGLSMRDAKTLLDFTVSRATERPLERDCIATLGLPSLPSAAPAQRAL